jgi:TonB family protein
MTLTFARRVLIGLAIGLSVSAAAAAQSALSQESQLQMQIAQNPRLVSTYLDLAKVYLDQKRYNEAEQALQRALALVQAERGLAGQPAADARFMMGGGSASSPATSTSGLAPVRVGGDIREPKKIRDVKPVYPENALANKIQGIVILEAVIGLDGSVESARVLRSVPELDQAAADAVRQWQFTPTLLNGAPVPVIMTVTVNFTLQ